MGIKTKIETQKHYIKAEAACGAKDGPVFCEVIDLSWDPM